MNENLLILFTGLNNKKKTYIFATSFPKYEWTIRLFLFLLPFKYSTSFCFYTGNEKGFITSFLELPNHHLLSNCPSSTRIGYDIVGCVRYPLSALYPHQTQNARHFYFELHVTNLAGHATSVNTSSTVLPADGPPSNAVVMDVIRTMVPIDLPWDPTKNKLLLSEQVRSNSQHLYRLRRLY